MKRNSQLASRGRKFKREKAKTDVLLMNLTKAFIKDKQAILEYQQTHLTTDEDVSGMIGVAFKKFDHQWQVECKTNKSGFKLNPGAFKENVELMFNVRPVKPTFNINDMIDANGELKPIADDKK